MSIGRRARFVAVVLALAAAGACKSAPSDIAELGEVLSGRAQKAKADQPWGDSRAGDRFRAGDAVRTSADGGARLRFLAGGGLRMGASTTIRFGPGKVAVEGELTAEEDSILELELGRAEIAAGSKVKIARVGEEVRFDVLVGKATVTRDESRMVLTAGQAIDVEVGGARVKRVAGTTADRQPAERPAAAPDAGPPAVAPDAGPAVAANGDIKGEVRGRGSRSRGPDGGDWRALPAGTHDLAAGTQVSVARGGTLLISRGDERAEVRGAADVVVAPEGPGGALAEARSGRAQVMASTSDVKIRVPGGTIVARRGRGAGSRAALQVSKSDTRIDVESGTVDVESDKGAKERLVLGQGGQLARGGSLEVLRREPDRADFSITAGLSASIHDPGPPTDVRVRFGDACAGGDGVLEVARGESFAARRAVQGKGAAIVRLDRGGHRYRVRCMVDGELADPAAASGRLKVIRDAGTKPLPRRAPHNTVDTDGRRYTVLYQNLLPSITFRWAKAPAAARYRLHVAPARGKAMAIDVSKANHTLAAGKLGEGEYRYWFDADGAESKRSILRIDFDNAAASAYLQSPRAGETWSGESVGVSGGAAEGWKVSAGGSPLPLDRQGRFSGRRSRASDENALVIELSHPSRGVHLYVRRGVKR